MPWDTPFPLPIALPDGQALATLRDAALYVQRLPKAEADTSAWQTALHVLLQAADHGGPVEFARIGMKQAIHPRAPVYDPSRKGPHWGRRRLARDR